MKIKATKSALIESLQMVQNVVSTKASALPILSHVLLSTSKKDTLFMTTTDIDVSVQCSMEVEVVKAGGGALPVRRFFSIIRELPDSTIEIETDDKNNGTVKCGSSYFKINGLSEDEFPAVEKVDNEYSYRVEQGAFRNMLKRTAYAVSTDETRYVLNGVYMSFKDKKLTMVATDGRRLALSECEVDVPKGAEAELIMPTKTVTELLRTLADEGELKIYLKKNKIMLEYGKVMIVSKLIEGAYPNYKQVIPGQCEERITIEREILHTALKRVSLITTDKASAAKLTFAKNKLTVSTNTPDVGEGIETIPIKYSGKSISVAFNPEFVMDPLKNLANDEIYIELTDDLSPGVIKCDMPFLYVLMPMRIS